MPKGKIKAKQIVPDQKALRTKPQKQASVTSKKRRKKHSRKNRNSNKKPIKQSSTSKIKPKSSFEKITAKEYSEQYNDRIVLIDRDDFYGLTVDLALYNLGKEEAIQVQNTPDYEAFKLAAAQNKFNSCLYLIDETFSLYSQEITDLKQEIKDFDDQGKFVLLSTSKDVEDIDAGDFEAIVIKSGRNNDHSLVKILSEILGVEFEMDNSDPEVE